MQADLLKPIKRFFQDGHDDKPAVQLAYVFGSSASGKKGPLSDIDIAVLFTETPAPESVYQLAHQLSVCLETDRIDLIVLNRAPVELRYAAIASGILVFEVDTSTRVDFEAQTLSFYGDYLPVLRQQRRDILKESNDESRIQRYREAFGKTERVLEKIRSTARQT
jgi:predicted nucleotidyltransferase